MCVLTITGKIDQNHMFVDKMMVLLMVFCWLVKTSGFKNKAITLDQPSYGFYEVDGFLLVFHENPSHFQHMVLV